MTDEEIETSRALGLDRATRDGMTLEDIAWREAFKFSNKLPASSASRNSQAFYDGFIAGFTYKFTGDSNEGNV